MTSSPEEIPRASSDRQIASVPEATPTADRTPQYAENSCSNFRKFGPLSSCIEEETLSHSRRKLDSMVRYFLVRSSRGIFIRGDRFLATGRFGITLTRNGGFVKTQQRRSYCGLTVADSNQRCKGGSRAVRLLASMDSLQGIAYKKSRNRR